jgi:hypothetical protein
MQAARSPSPRTKGQLILKGNNTEVLPNSPQCGLRTVMPTAGSAHLYGEGMDKKRLEDVYRILEKQSASEEELRKKKSKEPGTRLAQYVFILVGVLPFTLALLIVAGHKVLHGPLAKVVGLYLLLISCVAALVTPLIDMFANRRVLKQFLKDPWVLAHENVLEASAFDSETVVSLQGIGVEELAFAKLETTVEREALERRTALLVGAVEKAGILPSIIGFCVIILKIGETTQSAAQTNSLPWWMLALTYAAIGLQLLAIAVHMVVIRMDRHIKLLDFSTNHRPKAPALDEKLPWG